MYCKWFSVVILFAGATLLLIASSCAHNHDLVSITVSPSAFTYFAPAAPGVQQVPIPLTAYGTYIHPPDTVDITNQVTWASNNTVVADVSSSGQLTAGVACGVGNISASFYPDGNKSGGVIVGFMTVTVEGPASEGCPQGTATGNLSVNVTNPADGVITSSPAGINCGATCSAPFAASSSVTLTASPNAGHSFGGWQGCTSATGETCTVIMNTSSIVVSATFN